jgi:hypothetical protein
MPVRYPTSDAEVRQIVRDETSYDDAPNELPDAQLDGIIERAKGRMELSTGTDAWYVDDGLGFALAAYACMRAMAAVENAPLSSYNIGDEQVSFADTDPETSQQLQQWAEDVRVGLDASDRDGPSRLQMRNTSGYVGETSVRDREDRFSHH